MKVFAIILMTLAAFNLRGVSQSLTLKGNINVWNDASSILPLNDDFFYQLAPGDDLKIVIDGMANIAPYDEERKGGGFLGLFKKSYTVRIDNWLTADQVNIKIKIPGYDDIALTPDPVSKVLQGTFTIPFEDGQSSGELLKQMKLTGWVNQRMTPLRAGKYNISIEVDSRRRLDKLRDYFTNTVSGFPIVTFETHIKTYVENGKLIYRHPDETVKVVEGSLGNKQNIDGIKKDLYKYLLRFAPDNTTVRAGLSEVYLKELNFSEAQLNAQKTIVDLTKKAAEGVLDPKDKNDFGRAYEVVAGVNELKELGLQENAYSMGAVFYGQAADWYLQAQTTENYTRAIMNQVRCLQKVGDMVALKQASSILHRYNASFAP